MEVKQVLMAPCKEDLNEIVKLSQHGGVVHQNPTPDQRADTSQDDAELINVQWRV
jgi:hypothetical protein